MSAISSRVSASHLAIARHGRRQTPRIAAALMIRSHATPSGSTRVKSSTANAGPR